MTYPIALGTPAGYQQVALGAVAVALTVPNGTKFALLCAENGSARFRDDGSAPTAAVGQPLAAGLTITYAANFGALQFIAQAGNPLLNVSYYK